MSARELVEWQAYDAIEPIGPERAEIGLAILTATMVNLLKGRSGRRARPEDFLPRWGSKARRARTADVDAQIRETLGGLVKRKRI